ncbi:stage III sporulation protein AB [Alicyclobacillus cycloheptanicus]|uniref:Stage III sporulation protein AB n=1 Tax=Alicyclobacillus cycloheptanicus TaxID=1457 RepID=A0ABT9XDG9_9BACL|nr:stage III sporulation protein SpoIIIAB [Alicyclobacillus cycloheptanicus]MDQ0188350.1 stage III sporulation protein AB [Alicyclobacillus cycloheptanicus]WDM01059.1 stage III sporulation protein AB [Alicyclobacillus cycloheptanicus]
MIRALGAAMVVGASTVAGFRVASWYRRRPAELRALLQAVRLLQTEIEFSVTPLPQALTHVGKRTSAPASLLFLTAGEALEAPEVGPAEAFARGIAACEPKSALVARDFECLVEFGSTLGTSDRIHQSQQIEVTLARLSALEEEAREAQRRNERLWQYLGVLAGLLVVILLY